jgi:hypothetical protein
VPLNVEVGSAKRRGDIKVRQVHEWLKCFGWNMHLTHNEKVLESGEERPKSLKVDAMLNP